MRALNFLLLISIMILLSAARIVKESSTLTPAETLDVPQNRLTPLCGRLSVRGGRLCVWQTLKRDRVWVPGRV